MPNTKMSDITPAYLALQTPDQLIEQAIQWQPIMMKGPVFKLLSEWFKRRHGIPTNAPGYTELAEMTRQELGDEQLRWHNIGVGILSDRDNETLLPSVLDSIKDEVLLYLFEATNTSLWCIDSIYRDVWHAVPAPPPPPPSTANED